MQRNRVIALATGLILFGSGSPGAFAEVTAYQIPDDEEDCELLIVGGGLAGAAAAYEGLLAGRTVCLTELTDWVGGQISSQGTSALDERYTQRLLKIYSRGYLELRDRIRSFHRGTINPGDCWVSESCFFPSDGHTILMEMLEEAADEGDGTFKWFPSTVIKDLDIHDGQIQGAIAIQHSPAPDAPPLNTFPLSQTIEDWYRYEDSANFTKTVIRLVPPEGTPDAPTHWYVIDATETGELLALADVPYRVGVDPLSYREPSSSSDSGDPYCTQGFTYTFAMEATEAPQPHQVPDFYAQYEPYYSYEQERFTFDAIFTYRRILSAPFNRQTPRNNFGVTVTKPGDISMQNWTWGNDYRPGTAQDNLIYTRDQLIAEGQLEPGGWLGGMRTETLRRGEEHALGFFYWLATGTTDSQLGDGIKQPYPNLRYLAGLDTPMGTAHGLSKHPYMRESRRLVGRPSPGYSDGFWISEIDIARRDYNDPYYQETLPPDLYRNLRIALAGLEAPSSIVGDRPTGDILRRSRSTIYQDTVGVGHYAIDFHPCMALSPPEAPGNYERPGERRGAEGNPYPFQIPLRALIPQRIDNMLVAGKSIATSHIVAAAYRVHSFEWSSGVAAANAAAFALEQNILPYELVDDIPRREPLLEQLQQRLRQQGNPIQFPDTSIFNESWEDWR